MNARSRAGPASSRGARAPDASFEDTIAAIATPPGRGAIAIVRLSGPAVRALAPRLFRSRKGLVPRVATYGDVLDSTGAPLDRGLALFMAAPHTYTGEDMLELHVHGGPVVAGETLRSTIAAGARLAAPGEFTRRAFLAGKMDLSAAEAVADLIDAENRSQARAARARLAGGLTSEVERLRSLLGEVLEELAGAIDFPDEVPEPARDGLRARLELIRRDARELQATHEVGRLVREGIAVAIVGPPNAGKSSLLNALLGEERAIVSDVPGTTRDTIEEAIVIDGVRVRLVDTAGLRSAPDALEAAGIARSRRALDEARLLLVVIDGAFGTSDDARAVLRETAERPRIVFLNKADLGRGPAHALAPRGALHGSARSRADVARVRSAIARCVWGDRAPDFERPHLASVRQTEAVVAATSALDRALDTLAEGQPVDLISGDLLEAFRSLGFVTGAEATEAVLDGIFARFCIGK